MKSFAKQTLPAPLWKGLRRIKASAVGGLQSVLERAGYVVALRDDYYSPLPPVSRLKAKNERWNRPSAMHGVTFDLDGMKRELASLLSRYQDEFNALPSNTELRYAGYGPGLPAVDALTLYMTIRERKPKRYVEVGAGLSTYYCSLAARRNAMEGHPLEIISIDPFPFERLRTMPEVRLIQKEVQDVDVSLFEQLQENDILFIDSTHILKIDGDVPFLYLEVLPLLNVGVMVHVHDVPFPYNVPFPAEFWTLEPLWPVFWNEAMVLQAFLCHSEKFRITLSLPLLRHFDESFLRQHIRVYESVAENPDTFSSIWIRRVA